jgi:hypothetical protein
MPKSFGSVALTASWATVGTVPLPGGWSASSVFVVVRLKYTKHASQSGGYPVVRVRYKTTNAARTEVTSLDSVANGSTISVSAGVATIEYNAPEAKILALADSDGTLEFDLLLQVPPYKNKIQLQAKQAGDVVNFGTLAAELDGKI